MSIDAIKSKIGAIASYNQVQNLPKAESGKSFGQMFERAIREVDDMQKEADNKIDSLVLKKDGVTGHEAMISLEKADVAFQLMNQVRAKIIRAYEEVLRTQV